MGTPAVAVAAARDRTGDLEVADDDLSEEALPLRGTCRLRLAEHPNRVGLTLVGGAPTRGCGGEVHDGDIPVT